MKKLLSIVILVTALGVLPLHASDIVELTFDTDHRGATLSNGLVTMHVMPDGNINSVRFVNQEMAQPSKKGGNIYFSYVCDILKGGRCNADTVYVARKTDDLVEIIYAQEADTLSLNWQLGYIMRRGISGYYCYATVKAKKPAQGEFDNGVHEARIVHRLNPKLFNYAWVSDDNQGPQPSTAILKGPVEKIQDATFRLPDSTIYTKYDYSNYIKDDQLHGQLGDNIGAWLITPSFEWVNGGVQKQELTVHGDTKSPLLLQMFQSNHFGGVTTHFDDGQQKMYGPALVYYNKGTRDEMIADAKRQTAEELESYPYQWMKHDLFPVSRGTVNGNIVLSSKDFGTTRFQIVLAQPGSKPMEQGNSYQFWTESDEKGHFTIQNVRPGSYTLYAWALNGEATGTFEQDGINVKAGKNDVGTLNWSLPKFGKTLWRIGEADRMANGFKLSDHKRQYGMFNEVPAVLTFTIGKSNEKTDWYYAQTKNGKWNIEFNLDQNYQQPLRLTIATAGAANNTRCNVWVNDKKIQLIRTKNDSGIYRSAMQSGKDDLFTIYIDPKNFHKGKNTITLEVWGIKKMGGIMYDCIKLEANQ